MSVPRIKAVALAALAAVLLAGCSDKRSLQRQADRVYDRMTAPPAAAPALAPQAEAAAPAASPARDGVAAKSAAGGGPTLVLFFAPDNVAAATAQADAAPADPAVPDALLAAAETAAPQADAAKADVGKPDAKETDAAKAKKDIPFESLKGRSFGSVVKADLLATPGNLWKGAKNSFTRPDSLILLSAAFGLDRLARETLDHDIRDEFRTEKGSLAETGDFGSVAGNPALHFGIAGAWYAVSVYRQDDKNHAFSRAMIDALGVTGLTTVLLKVSMDDEAPNGEYYGWPSGHMSSSMAVASVMHEYYGWQAGVPLYLLSGYIGATRLQDREHDFSDLVFGAALGWVVGHSVVQGELPQLGGFTVLPWGGSGVGGVMLVKRW